MIALIYINIKDIYKEPHENGNGLMILESKNRQPG